MLHASTNHGRLIFLWIFGYTFNLWNIAVKASRINQKDDCEADPPIAHPLAPPQPELQAPLHEERVGKGSRRESRSNNFNETFFSCDGRVEGGYYGDPEAGCQVFHVCTNDGKGGLTKQSMSCPKGTLFQQKYFVCDWSHNVDCSTTEDFYELNMNRVRESRQLGLFTHCHQSHHSIYVQVVVEDRCVLKKWVRWIVIGQYHV